MKIPKKYSEEIRTLIERFEPYSVRIRFEKGHFKSNECRVENTPTIIINNGLNSKQVKHLLEHYLKSYETQNNI